MMILKTAAFCLLMVGIGGIAGAVETGTSPVNATGVFLAGCAAMAAYARLDSVRYRRDRELDRLMGKKIRPCHRRKPQGLKDH